MLDKKSVGDTLIRKAPVRIEHKISVSKALNSITDKSITNALAAFDMCEISQDKVATTIRLPNKVVEFYSVLAEELGISLQNALVISLAGLIESERENQQTSHQ